MSVASVLSDAFHAHLDECARCENRPFDLCPIGEPLLRAAGAAVGEAVIKELAKDLPDLFPEEKP